MIFGLLEKEDPLKKKLGKLVFDLLSEYTDDQNIKLAGLLFLLKKYPVEKFGKDTNKLVNAMRRFESVSLDCTEKESWEIRTKKLEIFSQTSFEVKLILAVINICLLELIVELHSFHGENFWQFAFFFRKQVALYFLSFQLQIITDFNHETVDNFTTTFDHAKKQLGWQRYYRLPV